MKRRNAAHDADIRGLPCATVIALLATGITFITLPRSQCWIYS